MSSLGTGVEVINIDSHIDARGSLRTLDFNSKLGFLPKRFFYLSEISDGATRGDHAHKQCIQFMIALRGKVTIEFDDGTKTSLISLGNSNAGVLVQPMIWTKLSQFSADALIFVLASHSYDEEDYLRKYQEFRALKNG